MAELEQFHEFEDVVPAKELGLNRDYFKGEMLAKHEPCVDAMKRVIDSDGQDDEAFNAFEESFAEFMNLTAFSTWDGTKYDLVFYGVSGYTGYLMMQYLVRTAIKRNPEPFTFAFAGRTPGKVIEQRDKNMSGTDYEDTACLQASYDDPQSVIDMCRSARVIVNVAGPYFLTQGDVLLDCCVRLGVHYCDVSGEIPWSCKSLDTVEESARTGNAFIIPSAAVAGGYPDVLMYLLSRRLKDKDGTPLRKGCAYSSGGGSQAGSSGGTLATRAAMSNAGDDVRKKMADSFALGGFIPDVDRNGFKEVTIKQGTGVVEAKIRKEEQDSALSKVNQCPDTGIWRAPHVYAYFDTRMVRRTNMLLADMGCEPYGKKFNFTEYLMLPPDAAAYMSQMKEASKAGDGPKGMPTMRGEKEMLEQQGKYFKQGEGPPLEELGDAWIGVMGWAKSEGGNQATTSFIGKDGYYETARCAVECAMCMRFNYDELNIKGGHVTATACGQRFYAERLVASGLKYFYDRMPEGHEGGPPEEDHEAKLKFP